MSAAARKGWATRRARGTDKPSPEKREAIREKFVQSLRRNRAARAAAMSPEERLADVVRRHEAMSAAARRGWVGRRERAGLPPGRAERAVVVRLYARDVEELERLGGTARAGLRKLLRVMRSVRAAFEEVAVGDERNQPT